MRPAACNRHPPAAVFRRAGPAANERKRVAETRREIAGPTVEKQAAGVPRSAGAGKAASQRPGIVVVTVRSRGALPVAPSGPALAARLLISEEVAAAPDRAVAELPFEP